MDEEYDVVILGTGLTECVMSGLMSVKGKKVLHMDRNNYYGGESTSISPLAHVFDHFKQPFDADRTDYGKGRDWNVDLIPKFLMANGKLVKLLIHTDVTRYLEFKCVEGSYVLKEPNKIDKVPCNEKEALTTGLLGIFEKRNFKNLITYIQKFDLNDTKTWGKLDPKQTTVEQLYQHFGISAVTQNVCGHALALYRNDEFSIPCNQSLIKAILTRFLEKSRDTCDGHNYRKVSYKNLPMVEFIDRCCLYSESLARYGKSPYLYPLYGLGELPQGFARLSAIYGGTYMLDKRIEKIVFDADGKVTGVQCEDGTVKCKQVICDPSYAPDRCKQPEKGSKVVRAICIMNHPIPNTKDSLSCQLIIPQSVVGRSNDIYVSMVSFTHNIAPKGFYVAIVSTTLEGDPDKAEDEIREGLKLLGPIQEKFVKVYDIYEQADDPRESNVFISKSYDATSHFETTCDDILDIYQKITGEPFDFSQVTRGLNQEDEQQSQ